MGKLIVIDINEIIFAEDVTIYEKELPVTLKDRYVRTVKIPEDELVRKLRVMFKNGETVYIEGNEDVTRVINMIGELRK